MSILDIIFGLNLKTINTCIFSSPYLSSALSIEIEIRRYQQPNIFSYLRNSPYLLNHKFKISCLHSYYKKLKSSRIRFLVNRNNLLNETFLILSNLQEPEIELKSKLEIKFIDEVGIDAGGLSREFFQLIIEEMFESSRAHFIQNNNFYWFNPEAKDVSSSQSFYLLGILFGLALYNEHTLNVTFPIALYRKLKKMKVRIEDLDEYDKQLTQSLKSILEYQGNVEQDLLINFVHDNIPLLPNGENLSVNNENRQQYVDLVIDYIFNVSVQQQFEEFQKGFYLTAGQIAFSIFHPEELSLLIQGNDDLDFFALESVAKYQKYFDAKSIPVQNFWDIIHKDLNRDEKRKLLYFFSASFKAPIGGLGHLPFVISRDPNPDHYPTSHTCFVELVLPDNHDRENLKSKLLYSINTCLYGFENP